MRNITKITQSYYLNQFHLWLDDVWFDDAEFDAVDDDVGIFWLLFVFVRTPRFIVLSRFISLTELLVSAFRCSSNAVRKNDIVVSWCFSCEVIFFFVVGFWFLLAKCSQNKHNHVNRTTTKRCIKQQEVGYLGIACNQMGNKFNIHLSLVFDFRPPIFGRFAAFPEIRQFAEGIFLFWKIYQFF